MSYQSAANAGRIIARKKAHNAHNEIAATSSEG